MSSQSTTQACAACKYQRRKCQPNCALAPYFPADQQQSFLNAQRLFGVSKILKILHGLDPALHQRAMQSIVFHSNLRALDPVLGCCRVIEDLNQAITDTISELQIVLRHLAFYRAKVGDDSAIVSSLNVANCAPQLPIFYAQDDNKQESSNYFHPNGVGVNINESVRVVGINENSSSSSSTNVFEKGQDLLASSSGTGSDELYEVEEDKRIAQHSFDCNYNNFDINYNIDINSAYCLELKDEPLSIQNDLKGAASLFTLSRELES